MFVRRLSGRSGVAVNRHQNAEAGSRQNVGGVVLVLRHAAQRDVDGEHDDAKLGSMLWPFLRRFWQIFGDYDKFSAIMTNFRQKNGDFLEKQTMLNFGLL
jgi:hypothetical protein